MKQGIFEITLNRMIAPSVLKMALAGDTSEIRAPGQFVNIKIDGLFLRRPISVYDWDKNTLTIIYKVVGRGTADMQKMQSGKKLDVLTGLGNGYDVSRAGARPLLVGGGVGIPPLYGLAKRLTERGCRLAAVLG